jgi:restriction system protein
MFNEDREFIDVSKMSLEKWLNLFSREDRDEILFNGVRFPTDILRDEYLTSIQSRTEEEVKSLLYEFLVPTDDLGNEEWIRQGFKGIIELHLLTSELSNERIIEMQNDKTLIWSYSNCPDLSPEQIRQRERDTAIDKLNWVCRSQIMSRIMDNQGAEGNLWILDLLPSKPKMAIDAIDAYMTAHFEFLSDNRIWGLGDSMAIIRAKFLGAVHPSSVLDSLDPYRFEELIANLYSKMKFAVELTPRTHDGGRDIIANKDIVGEKQRLLIQCKRSKNTVGVETIRALLGVVSHERATKGVLVTNHKFSSDAKKLAASNSRIELISQMELQSLLNHYFGASWSSSVDYYASFRARNF